MREIQDLTLQVERGLAAVDKALTERHEAFINASGINQPSGHERAGMRATLIPLVPLYLEHVHKNPEVEPKLVNLKGMFRGTEWFDVFVPRKPQIWRPILRGTRSTSDPGRVRVAGEVHCSGLVELAIFMNVELREARKKPLFIYPSWVICLVVNAMCAAERFRRAAGAPEVEYGMELEIATRSGRRRIGRYTRDPFNESLGEFPAGSTMFPRYSVGPPSEFQEVIRHVERDFWHVAGEEHDEPITLDFKSAFDELGIPVPESS